MFSVGLKLRNGINQGHRACRFKVTGRITTMNGSKIPFMGMENKIIVVLGCCKKLIVVEQLVVESPPTS